jgi:hypothetical protein
MVGTMVDVFQKDWGTIVIILEMVLMQHKQKNPQKCGGSA